MHVCSFKIRARIYGTSFQFFPIGSNEFQYLCYMKFKYYFCVRFQNSLEY